MNNFWKTVEVESWSRGFRYEDYLLTITKMSGAGMPLTEDGYLELCKILDIEFEDQYK